MAWTNTKERWGAIAKTLHWGVAITILAMIPFGWWMEGIEDLSVKIEMYQYHKATGVVLLLFVLTRIAWRLSQPTPALPNDMPRWERVLAHAGHGALYAMIFLQPVIGIVMSQSSPVNERFPVALFGWPLPDMVPNDRNLQLYATIAHSWAAWAIVALVAMHVAAALKHHFVDKNRILVRMLPGG